MLGNGRLEAMCFDGVKRLCHIRGKLRKKVWINQSDIILVSLFSGSLDLVCKMPQKVCARHPPHLRFFLSGFAFLQFSSLLSLVSFKIRVG